MHYILRRVVPIKLGKSEKGLIYNLGKRKIKARYINNIKHFLP